LSYRVSDQRMGRGAFGSKAEERGNAEHPRPTPPSETEMSRPTRPEEGKGSQRINLLSNTRPELRWQERQHINLLFCEP